MLYYYHLQITFELLGEVWEGRSWEKPDWQW